MELSRPPCPAEDVVAPLEKSTSTITTPVSRSGGKRTAFWVAIAALLAAVWGQSENTVRQRLREWPAEAAAKKGRKRVALDVRPCFAPLLAWVLSSWPAADDRARRHPRLSA